MEKLKEIKKPIGDFITKNSKGNQTENGVYYHYSEVCSLLKKHEEQLTLIGVSQQRELLSDFMRYLLENGYLNTGNLKDFIVQDYIISLNCG